ncbi:DNA-binding protein [Halomarina salina]|uniref:DNA-binding protein n=1 Tax=Halomarina salina TaxID=1872699 RepID=A0ABD5RM43_9EURY|nr:DNA-binding protein [Halomarina salina]
MATRNVFGNEVSVDEQGFEQTDERAVDEDGFEVVDETPELRASVQQEIQAKVDANHPDGMVTNEYSHLPLATEERIRGREAELERISAKATLGRQSGRERRTRVVVTKVCNGRASTPDPRATLSPEVLGTVNRQAGRIAERVGGAMRAALSKRIAERVGGSVDVTSAVLDTVAEQKAAAGCVVPIAEVPGLDTFEVSVEGELVQTWEASHGAIQQVGLLADDSGQIKLTVWEKSDQPWIDEGQRVRIRGAAKNWYNGRCSLALTYDSQVIVPERGRWWTG